MNEYLVSFKVAAPDEEALLVWLVCSLMNNEAVGKILGGFHIDDAE